MASEVPSLRLQPRIRAAAVIVDAGSRVLMAQHEKEGRRYWLLPGGGVHHGELLKTAVARELREEACVEVAVGGLAFLAETRSPNGARHIIHAGFHARIVAGRPVLGEDPRVRALAWLDADGLAAEPVYPAIKEFLIGGLRTGFSESAQYWPCEWMD